MQTAPALAYTRQVLFRIRRPRDESDFAPEAEGPAMPGHEQEIEGRPGGEMTNPDIRMATPPTATGSQPIPLRELKGQASAYDARAERLVLGIRAEVEELREAVASRQHVEESVLRVDADALMSEPGLVAAVPPILIARLVEEMRSRIEGLEDELRLRSGELDHVQSQYSRLQQDYASAQGRLGTMEDIIGALHANLQDLRAARDYERQAALRQAPSPLPLPPSEA